MKIWICKRKLKDGEVCGQIVMAAEKPQPIHWSDGHVCFFEEEKKV